MRLIRFGPPGEEKPGLLDQDKIVDLRKFRPEIPDINSRFFREGWLEKLKDADFKSEKMDVRLGCPVESPSKIICLGKNYAEHAKEGGFDKPQSPLLFCKTPNTLNGPFDPIILPQSSKKIDWEVELAVIIKKQGKRIKKEDALDYIAGVTILNDVSGRDAQFADSQWFRGKSFDTFAPVGPCIVTLDEMAENGKIKNKDLNNLQLQAVLNNDIMQNANTGSMIFDIPSILEFVSTDMTLYPGDIISTGTPEGVGFFRDPPILLQEGDVIECRIEKIGSIKNRVIK
jgi:2,4-didehydro-3-deoxy-L-rhamnonate hydrolase